MALDSNGRAESETVTLRQADEMRRTLIWIAMYEGNPNNLKTQARTTLDKLKIKYQ